MSVGPLHLHFVIPGLFGPFAGQGKPGFPEPHTPCLAEFVARGSICSTSCSTVNIAPIYSQFGYHFPDKQDAPDAWLSYQADTGRVPAASLLLAAPVHMRPDRSRLVLFDADSVDITQTEADELVQYLNRHLIEQGMQLEVVRPSRWYLHLSASPQIQCTSLQAAMGQDVDACLPRGVDARRWHAFMNEVQMLLHATEVNQQREMRGRPTLNSLWLWGGGAAIAPVAHAWQRIWADDAVSKGLAQLNRVQSSPVPESAQSWLQQAEGDRHLLVFEGLQKAVAYGDIEAWVNQLEALEAHWFAPLRSTLRTGRLQQLTLEAGNGRCIEISRWSIWKLWKRSHAAMAAGMA